MIRYSLIIEGIVQGVGFRPFMYRLAKSLLVNGYVQNTSDGVYAEIEGEDFACESFINELKNNPPPLAKVDSIQLKELGLKYDTDFMITESHYGIRNAKISPDLGICDECAKDIADKNSRRYRYAFTNCTNCGPRFSIISDIPYDRKNTTMAEFKQCSDCLCEYEDPYDRRFHAQPNACPLCGPKLQFYKGRELQPGDPFTLFDNCIRKGEIIAIKGIGGYHLACDGRNNSAVKRLRRKKIRYDKPFALMMRNIETVKLFCNVNKAEEELLLSERKPIVLLTKRDDCSLGEEIAPNNGRLGVMLPYTPLHSIIMQNRDVLVMTSGNISDQPMMFDDREAIDKLFDIADGVLTHNRKIHRRMDDSVCIVAAGKTHILRRARGYAPEPLRLRNNKSVILALGGQQKNTFCLAKGEDAILSAHMGDLDDMDTEASFKAQIQSYIKIFDAKPEIIACDMHPDYASTRYAQCFKGILPIYEIQHHHAHFASVLAEHCIGENAIGIIFDGTGYGKDGTLWGGEVLFGEISESKRIGHMLEIPLLGGDAAIREPWRIALAMVNIACGEADALDFFQKFEQKAELLLKARIQNINCPISSGAGRLFDAVSALVGIRTYINYEGQAAIELEQAMDSSAQGSYNFDIIEKENMLIFDWRQLIREIVQDAKKDLSKGSISAKFHRAMVNLIIDISKSARNQYGNNVIALSGGVFQNTYLLSHTVFGLEDCGFMVYTNERIPTNDGGISFGQAAVASRLFQR